MKIERIEVENFLGLRDFTLEPGDRTLIVGRNGAGKSSIRDAIRFAALGDPGRGIEKKKDFGALLSEGAKKGKVSVTIDGHRYQRCVKTGGAATSIPEPPESLPYVLDADRFAAMGENARRSFLMGLMGVKVKPADIANRLVAKGVSEAMAERVTPLLRSGFDAACAEAKTWARDAKRDWQAITGEQWGASKGERWEADVPESLSAEEINKLEDAEGEAKRLQNTARMEAHDLRNLAQQAMAAQHKIDEATAAKEKHSAGESVNIEEVAGQISKLQEAKSSAETPVPCPCCNAMLVVGPDGLREAGEPVDVAGLQDQINQLKLQLNDAKQWQAAEQELARVSGVEPVSDADIKAADKAAADAEAAWDKAAAELAQAVRASEEARNAGEATDKARAIHETIEAALNVAELLSPDGIPAEILAEALGPINKHLDDASNETGWPLVSIGADMVVRRAGRPYGLCSESEQWRVDAMLAYAIASLSELKLMVLDRVDVLDLPGRGEFVGWVSGMDGMQVIATGTFKSAPTIPSIDSHWIENGRVSELEEAA